MAKRVVFDPNAEDGDGDMKVQDNTVFERPTRPQVSPAIANLTVERKKRQTSAVGRFKRTNPIRPTNVTEKDVSTGGDLKASEIFRQDLLRGLTADEQRTFLGVDKKTYAKMKKENASVNSFAADDLAINAFGYHPTEIWGDAWMTEQILYPKRSQVPPRRLTDMENRYLDLRSQGKIDADIAKELGVSTQRVNQLKNTALKKRDQESILEDEEIDKQIRTLSGLAAADAVFLDTGTSPTGLIGRMTGDVPDDHPVFETQQEREDREQAFADFIYEAYIEPFQYDFWQQNGATPSDDDLFEFLNTVDEFEIRERFENEKEISSWGLEYDEEGNVSTAEWAEQGFLSEADWDDWFDGPMADAFTGTSRDRGKQQGSLFDDNSWEDYRSSKEYTTYGGTEDLMARNTEQHQKFSSWATARDWKKFHHEHFDWWAFPIDEVSNTYGERFRVPEDELKKLRSDQEFLKRLDENLTNASSAYGWDIQAGRWIPDDVRDQDQVPQSLSQIRLYKMARSALVFGRCSHFRSLQRMYDNLSSFGWYKGQDEGFWAKDHPCSQS